MLLKLLGAAILLVTSGGVILHAAGLFRERLRQLEGFLSLLHFTRERIACFRTPTDKIFASFENEALARIGFLRVLRSEGLLAALRAVRPRIYLDEEEIAPLFELAGALGGGYSEEEVARCDLATAALSETLTRRRESQPRSAKLCRTLVLGASLALIIVLI